MRSAAKQFRRSRRGAIVAPQAVKIEAMSKVSTLRKIGVVARVAREQAGRSRRLNAVKTAVFTSVRSVGRVLHMLWLEVTGAVFLSMAAFGAFALFREYTKYTAGHTTIGRVVLASCFTLTFAWFGLTSFWKTRRKSQRP